MSAAHLVIPKTTTGLAIKLEVKADLMFDDGALFIK